MKKIIITILLAAGTFGSVFAQSEREKGVFNKKGYQVLPQKGDFAIGIDANPFLEYGMSLFDRSGIGTPSFEGFNGSLYGKYFLRDNQAIRMRLMIGVNSTSIRYEVLDDTAPALQEPGMEAKVIDRRRESNNMFGLFGGYEFRRGYGRLQGFVGGELGFMVGAAKESYKWGNEFSSTNTSPTSVYDWDTGDALGMNVRQLWIKGGTMYSVQMGLFAGVEFFFARKMSIGGELGLNLNVTGQGQGKINIETFDTGSGRTTTRESKDALKSAATWSFTTPVSGNIFLMFHF